MAKRQMDREELREAIAPYQGYELGGINRMGMKVWHLPASPYPDVCILELPAWDSDLNVAWKLPKKLNPVQQGDFYHDHWPRVNPCQHSGPDVALFIVKAVAEILLGEEIEVVDG